MKKLLSLALAACLALSLVACSNNAGGGSGSGSGAGSGSGSGSGAPATDFPTKPITLICAWAAGGGSDQICRAISTVAEKYLPEAIVVQNREGSGGVIGLTEASRADADGYTEIAYNI